MDKTFHVIGVMRADKRRFVLTFEPTSKFETELDTLSRAFAYSLVLNKDARTMIVDKMPQDLTMDEYNFSRKVYLQYIAKFTQQRRPPPLYAIPF